MAKAILFNIILSTAIGCILFAAQTGANNLGDYNMPNAPERITIITLFDNYEFQEGLNTSWGFSALIHIRGKTILFDTGGNGSILLQNIDALGLKPQKVDALLLSHNHGDHTGGLNQFLNKWGAKKVYIPRSFASRFRSEVGQIAELVEVTDAVEIFSHVFSTGEMGTSIIEQSLIIETEKGLVVITGCAHPGIVGIVEKAKELRNKDIYLVIGGFHLGGKSDKEMAEIIKAFRTLGVKKVSPSHCTGDRQIELFKKEYGEDFIRNGAGKKIVIAE